MCKKEGGYQASFYEFFKKNDECVMDADMLASMWGITVNGVRSPFYQSAWWDGWAFDVELLEEFERVYRVRCTQRPNLNVERATAALEEFDLTDDDLLTVMKRYIDARGDA